MNTADICPEEMAATLRIPLFVAFLLIERGIFTYEAAKQFFNPLSQDLHSPFLMSGMETAVKRIHQAIENKERILIYGDYDMDGVMSIVILYKWLHLLTDTSPLYYIPHRILEGYGTTDKGIAYVLEKKTQLLITVDCGIRSQDHIHQLNQHGVDSIICDHHLPHEGIALPNAHAILNPNRASCSYPCNHLCGAGVVLKLIHALSERYYPERAWLPYLPYAAMATIADMVPLKDENRILVAKGLAQLNKCIDHYPDIKALKTNDDAPITEQTVGFHIGPCINAVGRMHSAYDALSYFLIPEEIPMQANDLFPQRAEKIKSINQDRRNLQQQCIQKALADLHQSENELQNNVLMLFGKHWHQGVLGLIASHITEKFHKPTIVTCPMKEDPHYLVGSARSVQGVDITAMLDECAHLLERYGGHSMAAGLTLKKERFSELYNLLQRKIPHALPLPQKTGVPFPINNINEKNWAIVQRMAPFGIGNPEPVFVAEKISLQEPPRIMKDAHIKFFVSNIPAIGFNLQEKTAHINFLAPFNVYYTMMKNSFRGEETIEARIQHIEPAAS